MTDAPIRFQPGTVVVTLGALQIATPHQLGLLLDRHTRGDWGDVSAEDQKANEAALKHGARLLSSYTTESGERLWVLTEANRQQTTVLTPGEY